MLLENVIEGDGSCNVQHLAFLDDWVLEYKGT
jgi:hypothetical protein